MTSRRADQRCPDTPNPPYGGGLKYNLGGYYRRRGCGDSSTLSAHISMLALKQKMLRLNQAKISDNVIRKSDMGKSKWLNPVSKCQCEMS